MMPPKRRWTGILPDRAPPSAPTFDERGLSPVRLGWERLYAGHPAGDGPGAGHQHPLGLYVEGGRLTAALTPRARLWWTTITCCSITGAGTSPMTAYPEQNRGMRRKMRQGRRGTIGSSGGPFEGQPPWHNLNLYTQNFHSLLKIFRPLPAQRGRRTRSSPAY